METCPHHGILDRDVKELRTTVYEKNGELPGLAYHNVKIEEEQKDMKGRIKIIMSLQTAILIAVAISVIKQFVA